MRMLLRDTAARVNSADPGFTAPDLNGHRARHAPIPGSGADAIQVALRWSTLLSFH
jgi:hypothetical protein